MLVLTDPFTRAVDYARIAHAAQLRRGSDIPYLYQMLGVASVVIEYGDSQDPALQGCRTM